MRILDFSQRWYWLLASVVLIIGLVVACATPGRPEGGPQDRQAPKLNTKKFSTPNPSTNFKYKRVILTFDEWVKLQAASSKVVVSPPLQTRPTIRVRNKSVVVEWEEELVDSTTYIINFGDAIQDITEGNAVQNKKIVFSTGPYLDSLTCSGQIIDAGTRKPVADAWVMLYRNLADSVPKTEKPFYFTKTNGSGSFKIDYIRKGRYRIFALDDNNNDYKYNLPGESIGFLDSTFVINDTIQPFLRLLLFKERRDLAVEESDLFQFGDVHIRLNEAVQSPTEVRLLDAPSDLKLLVEQGEDSLHIWMDGSLSDTAKLRLVLTNEVEDWQDTVVLSNKGKADLLTDSTALRWVLPKLAGVGKIGSGKSRLSMGKQKTNSSKNSFRPTIDTTTILQHPRERLALHFTAPITEVDTNLIIWAYDTSVMVQEWRYSATIDSATGETTSIDSSQVTVERDTFIVQALPPISRDSNVVSVLYLTIDSTSDKRYQLTLLPNAVRDFWGRNNGDTLSRIYTLNKLDQYGSITTLITNADSSKVYLIELVNSKNVVVNRHFIQDSTSITFVDYYLPTGPYTIHVSTDLNNNKRWDVGSYDRNEQPEPRFISKVIQLKAGWENVMKIDWEQKDTPSSGKISLTEPTEKPSDTPPKGGQKNRKKGKSKMKQR